MQTLVGGQAGTTHKKWLWSGESSGRGELVAGWRAMPCPLRRAILWLQPIAASWESGPRLTRFCLVNEKIKTAQAEQNALAMLKLDGEQFLLCYKKTVKNFSQANLDVKKAHSVQRVERPQNMLSREAATFIQRFLSSCLYQVDQIWDSLDTSVCFLLGGLKQFRHPPGIV